ncbi:hypothetical protein DMH01_03235 [Amycolatopsis sp. WAC 04182]|uniref:hypothetical protein n=1 Tax=Amycolatopsis sp. WAC 04182 TaxID=2203198 RepID=UPI000F7A41F8|nr:hypothetical protein [Amycolatopsis sp. WAC 04182]RSN65404.1 hypothetical protein DMH01_03235 [Amycolatopsis sp. WAC 04182]
MPVSFGAVAVSGASDSLSTTCPIAVAGLGTIAAGDILVFAIEMWESATSPVTWPTGTGTWTQIVDLVSGSTKLRAAWCRALGTETGSLTASWTGSQWRLGHLIRIPGALAAGDPVEVLNTATGTGTSVPSTSVTIATLALLLHLGSSENGTSQTTPPTSFTNAANGNVLRTNHRYPGATGTYTASGGVLAASSLQHAVLIAIKPAAGAGDSTGTGALTAPASVAAGTGTVPVTGAGATTAPKSTSAATGAVIVAAAGAATAPASVASGAGGVVATGTGAATAPTAIANGAGTVVVTGNGALTAPASVASGTGGAVPAIEGTGALVAPAAVALGAGVVIISGIGHCVAPASVASGSESLTAPAEDPRLTIHPNLATASIRANQALLTMGDT